MKVLPILLLLFLITSCSESVSKSSYIFKDAPKTGLVGKIGDKEVTEAQMNEGIESDLYEAERKIYDIKFNRLKAMVMEEFVTNDPRKKGLSNDEYLEKYIAKSVNITEKDVDQFIKKENIPAEHINPMVREKIKSHIEMEKKREAVDNWLSQEMKKKPVEIYLARPKRPTFDVQVGDSPFIGKKDAPITIVEYSDFQCPYCKRAAQTIGEVKKKYGDKVRVVFRNFPLPFHSQAKVAAAAGLCANEQGADQFWKMHDSMFGNQEALTPEALKESAKKLGLKVEQFNQCLDSNKYAGAIEADIESGKKVNVKSTPTFFVNGQLLSGAQPAEVFEEVIDDVL